MNYQKLHMENVALLETNIICQLELKINVVLTYVFLPPPEQGSRHTSISAWHKGVGSSSTRMFTELEI